MVLNFVGLYPRQRSSHGPKKQTRKNPLYETDCVLPNGKAPRGTESESIIQCALYVQKNKCSINIKASAFQYTKGPNIRINTLQDQPVYSAIISTDRRTCVKRILTTFEYFARWIRIIKILKNPAPVEAIENHRLVEERERKTMVLLWRPIHQGSAAALKGCSESHCGAKRAWEPVRRQEGTQEGLKD